MDIRILGWQYKNVRGMRDVEIDLGNPPPRWTLIQMPNGTGKTTTINLMRLALSEEIPDASVVRSFRPDEETTEGTFTLKMTVDNEPCWLFVKFNFMEGKVRHYSSRASLTGGGLEPGHRLKHNLQSLLTPAFTRLFVFDGELAKSIRDINRDEASKAIRTLYHIDRIGQLRVAAQRIVENEQSRVKTEKGLSNLAGRLRTAESTLQDLRTSKGKLEAERSALQESINTFESQRLERISSSEQLRTRLEQATSKRSSLETEITRTLKEIAETSRNPAAVSAMIQRRLHSLAERLQQLKLPKTTSAEFFHELAEAKSCICGRTIGDIEKQHIISSASNYLGENQVAVINAMKDALRHSDTNPDTLRVQIEDLKSLVRQRKKVDQDLDRLAIEREEQGDHELETIRAELNRLRGEMDDTDQRYRQLTASSKLDQQTFSCEWTNNIKLCERQYQDAAASYAEATNTLRLMQQSEYLQDVLQRIEHASYARLRDRVQNATNKKLESLAPGETLRVSQIGTSLQLASDSLGAKESVSEGQGLSVAYAFLASLFEDAPYRFPFVVDSPAVSLDTRVRREVADLIPPLFQQAIFFVISSEREGFAESFYDRKETKFLTVETPKGGSTLIHEGVQSFRQFHSDDEERNGGASS